MSCSVRTAPPAGSPTDYLAPPAACPGALAAGDRHGRAARARLPGQLGPASRRPRPSRTIEHSARCGGEGCLDRLLRRLLARAVRHVRTASTAASGYRYSFWAENLYWGQQGLGTPRAAMRAWLLSPPHREHVFARTVRDAGIGRVRTSQFPARTT